MVNYIDLARRLKGKSLVLALFCWTVIGQPIKTVDGDTFDAKLHIWPGIHATERVRLLGVDTPELNAPTKEAGIAAKQFTELWLSRGDFSVKACKRDSFGRLLGVVTRGDSNLGDDLVAAGLGIVK